MDKVYGLLGLATRAGKIAFGTEQVLEAITYNKAKLVVIATDTSENSKKKIINTCDKNNVQYVEYGTIEQNSKAIGKTNKAVIAIKDIGFAESILKIIKK